MIKLFNRKTMVVYIIMTIVFALLGSTLIGLNLHYKKAFAEATKSENELTDKIVNGISTLLQGLVDQNSDESSEEKENDEPEYDAATTAIIKKRDLSFDFMIVSYCLMTVFIAMAIAAGEYPKYLEGDKYKAKLRRLEKAKKASNRSE